MNDINHAKSVAYALGKLKQNWEPSSTLKTCPVTMVNSEPDFKGMLSQRLTGRRI